VASPGPPIEANTPRTRVYGQPYADEIARSVRKQGGRGVRIRPVLGYEGQLDGWFLVTWNRPEPLNIHHHLWWIAGLLMAYGMWRINY